jgi:hypothetical protein
MRRVRHIERVLRLQSAVDELWAEAQSALHN